MDMKDAVRWEMYLNALFLHHLAKKNSSHRTTLCLSKALDGKDVDDVTRYIFPKFRPSKAWYKSTVSIT
jgi:hypothetical protein